MRKNSKRLFFAIFFLCSVFPAKAQESGVKEILDRATAFYKTTPNYSVEMTFTLYRGLTGVNATESYKGSMEKSASYSKNSVLGTEVYHFDNAMLILEREEKRISYSKTRTQALQNSVFEISALLKYYEKSQLLDKGSEWVCEMVSKQNNFSQLPYGKVLLHINKKDYRINKQVLYFSQKVPFNAKDGGVEQDFGRLEIKLSHDFDRSVPERVLSEFLTKTPKEELKLTKAYADYQLIDQTEYN